MARAATWKVVLPLIVFPSLTALAAKFIFGHLFASELAEKIATQCPAMPTPGLPYLIPYTGYPSVDKEVCGLVVFFQATMGLKIPSEFLAYFIGIGAPVIILPAIEACRSNRSLFIAYPLVWGLLTQAATVGVIMPLYWLIFILTGALGDSQTTKAITQGHAEAIVFGVVIGAAVPSVSMLVLNDPYVTAICQLYPVYVSLAQFAHLQFRSPSQHPQSGFRTLQALYIGAFIVSSSLHVSTIWPMLRDYDALKLFFVPSITPLDPATDIGMQTFDFLKWDFVFGLGSSLIATLWFAKTFHQVLLIGVWNLIALPFVGPGAAIYAVALWRESNLETSTMQNKQVKS